MYHEETINFFYYFYLKKKKSIGGLIKYFLGPCNPRLSPFFLAKVLYLKNSLIGFLGGRRLGVLDFIKENKTKIQ